MRKTPIPAVRANITLSPEHIKVLRGLLMRNPQATLSAIIALAIDPYCIENKDAADEVEIRVEVVSVRPAKELV